MAEQNDVVMVLSHQEVAGCCILITDSVLAMVSSIQSKEDITPATVSLMEVGVAFVGQANKALGNPDSADLATFIDKLKALTALGESS